MTELSSSEERISKAIGACMARGHFNASDMAGQGDAFDPDTYTAEEVAEVDRELAAMMAALRSERHPDDGKRERIPWEEAGEME